MDGLKIGLILFYIILNCIDCVFLIEFFTDLENNFKRTIENLTVGGIINGIVFLPATLILFVLYIVVIGISSMCNGINVSKFLGKKPFKNIFKIKED